jgi:predicted negative regulator of RcsB-dependent stress response
MKGERLPLDPADDEELRSAAALARALDGGSAGSDLPQAALETAALLRLSAGAGTLDEKRRAEIRAELLTGLPRAAARQRGSKARGGWLPASLPRWLIVSFPLAGVAALGLLMLGRPTPPEAGLVEGALAARDSDRVEAGAELVRSRAVSAELSLPPSSARQAVTGLGEEARARRATLLARLNDATLARVHGDLDAARSPSDVSRSQRAALDLLETVGPGLDAADARLIRQDLYCRLAETALRLGEPRAALEWARRGLDLNGPPTPFLAQLMALEGDAWAALGDDSNAANSYMKALRAHEVMLDESLDGR